MRKERGITLISLVITIVILIILAGVAISMTLGENGIFTKAQEAKKMQGIASAKEQIGLEILEAQIEAIDNNEELEQSQVEEIVAKYGVLQANGDTIILNDTGYEVSLKDIYNEMAKEEGDETTELAQLKALLAQTTVTEDKILKDFKAYKDGQLIAGTMENYAGQTLEASSISTDDINVYLTVPQAGYYDTTSKISTLNSNLTYKEQTVYAVNDDEYDRGHYVNGNGTLTFNVSDIKEPIAVKNITSVGYGSSSAGWYIRGIRYDENVVYIDIYMGSSYVHDFQATIIGY